MKFLKPVKITGLTCLLVAGSLTACQSNPPIPFTSESSPPLSSHATPQPVVQSPSLTLTAEGFGAVQVNMSVEAAEKALGQPLIAPYGKPEESSGSTCYYLKPEQGVEGLEFMVIDEQIARVDVTGNQVLTQAGAKVGDSEDQIQSLYPDIKITPHKYQSSGHYMSVTPQDSAQSNYRLIFETDGVQVTSIRAGRLPEVEWVERCG